MLRSIIALLVLAAPLPAQVRGSVADAGGVPLRGVIVELWSGTRQVAAATSDARGGFALDAGGAARPLVLTARGMGLLPIAIDVASPDTTVSLRLDARPLALAAVSVAAESRLCPHREDPRARAAWERMRAAYWQPGADSVLLLGLMERRRGTGARDDVDDPRAGRAAPGWTYGAVAQAPAWAVRSGAAWRATGGTGERTAFWYYRALDAGMDRWLTEARFGEEHTLAFVDADPDAPVLGFCPRERIGEEGRVQGALTLRADGTLERARWRFRTRAPDEDAGGEAAFLPPDPYLGNTLLKRESAYWRRTAGGRYYFERSSFVGWRPWDGSAADARRGGEESVAAQSGAPGAP